MSRTVYLAGRYSRRLELVVYAADLEESGWSVTSRWLDGTHQYGPDAERAQQELGEHVDLAQRFAMEDVEDLRRADLVVSFTEEPRKPSTNRGGRHVEHGMAIALGKRVVVVGHRENAFHWLPEVEFHPTWPEALHALRWPDGWTPARGVEFSNLGHCRTCREPVAWGLTSNGRPSPHNRDGVSHFATCPQANQHRRSR